VVLTAHSLVPHLHYTQEAAAVGEAHHTSDYSSYPGERTIADFVTMYWRIRAQLLIGNRKELPRTDEIGAGGHTADELGVHRSRSRLEPVRGCSQLDDD
jgi:hypothetical protein